MFTFTKTIEANIAYEVEWGTCQRQDGLSGKRDYFQTLDEAQQFVMSRPVLHSATICKKEFLQKYENGKFIPAMRGSVRNTLEDK